jgi:hypothetical protein
MLCLPLCYHLVKKRGDSILLHLGILKGSWAAIISLG